MSCSCDEGRYCDECFERAKAEYSYLRHVPRHQVCGDDQAVEEFNEQLRQTGRGHLTGDFE